MIANLKDYQNTIICCLFESKVIYYTYGREWNRQTSRYAHSIEWGRDKVVDRVFVGSKPTDHTNYFYK